MAINGDGGQENAMHKPVIKWDWNIGNIITLCVIIAGFITGYTRLESTGNANSTAIVRLESKDDTLQKQLDTLRDIISQQQLLVASKLSRIETIVERIEKRQNP